MSIIVGSTIAFFLNSLAWVTHIRIQYPWLFYILPLAGLVLFFLYKHFGQNTIAGNNLIIDEIHQPQNGVPILMAPFILFSTLFTHLFGGSAGREGTAVQIGGSIASYIGEKFQLSKANRSLLLMTGVSAGFGAVFGSPLAGTIFAIEVVVFAHLYHRTLIYCLIAAYLGHFTCLAYGVHHTSYSIQSGLSTTNPKILPIVIIAGCFGENDQFSMDDSSDRCFSTHCTFLASEYPRLPWFRCWRGILNSHIHSQFLSPKWSDAPKLVLENVIYHHYPKCWF